MNKADYDNQLRRQCFSIPELCEDQIRGIKKGLEMIPKDMLKGIRKVVMTGCGDSYLAALAAIPAFKRYAGAFASKFEAVRCIEAAKYLKYEDEQGDAVLVIGISASGGPARVAEALKKAGKRGCRTLVVTNNPKSVSAEQAEFVLAVNTPVFPEPGPGLRNYYASIMGLMGLAVSMGQAKGFCCEETEDELFEKIRAYTSDYKNELKKIDEIMFKTALKWYKHKGVEMIGDWIQYPSAYFAGAKYVEVAGIMASATDSENWCHVNYFKHDPEFIGTIFWEYIGGNNYSRMEETISQAVGINRPVLVISDNEREAQKGVIVCSVPSAPEGFSFLTPLLDYIPGAILASYVAALNGEPYFRAEESPQHQSLVGSTIADSIIEA